MINIQKILDKITYKPGCTFQCFPDRRRALVVIIKKTKDSDNPQEDIRIYREFYVDQYLVEEKEFILMLQNAIESLEIHEIDEWLRFDGKRIREPH